MSQDKLLKLVCKDCKNANYFVTKNKKLVTRKLEFKKFCSKCKKHIIHQEKKM